MRDDALRLAIEKAGGTAKVADHFGISSQAVSQWDRCPSGRVIALEDMTGGAVSRHELRPDLYPLPEGSGKAA